MREYRLGIGLLVGSVLLISCSDTVAKLMTRSVPVMQIALFQAVAMLLFALVLGRGATMVSLVRTNRPGLHLTRSLCQLASALCFFTGLKYLPLAEMVAIIFIGPLLITVLAAVVLKEQVGPRRWLACVVGFAGAMVVVRPGLDNSLGWTALFPLASTTLYSVYVICTRLTAPLERSSTMMFYACVTSVVLLGAASPSYWVTPVSSGWLGLIAVALISATSAALAIRAYALAPASLLAPYAYVEIVSAAIFGYLVFDDLPDGYTVSGAALVVSSGLYVFHRERRAASVVR